MVNDQSVIGGRLLSNLQAAMLVASFHVLHQKPRGDHFGHNEVIDYFQRL